MTGDTRVWTRDLSICSRMLYHWAISPRDSTEDQHFQKSVIRSEWTTFAPQVLIIYAERRWRLDSNIDFPAIPWDAFWLTLSSWRMIAMCTACSFSGRDNRLSCQFLYRADRKYSKTMCEMRLVKRRLEIIFLLFCVLLKNILLLKEVRKLGLALKL